MSTDAKPEKGRLNQDSPLMKIDNRASAEVGRPRSKASQLNGGVASLGGIQAPAQDLRLPLRKCGQRPPAGVRTWSPPPSATLRAKSPLASSDGLRSNGILDNWSPCTVNGACGEVGLRVGKAIPAKGSPVSESRSKAVGARGSAGVSGSPIQRLVSVRKGIPKSAAVIPGQGLTSIEGIGSNMLKNTAPNQLFEANHAIRQSSAPLWTQVPVAVAEVLVAGLAMGKPHGPCVSPHLPMFRC